MGGTAMGGTVVPLSPDSLPHIGMGLIIMNALVDALSYSRYPDGRNCLAFTKYFSYEGQNCFAPLRIWRSRIAVKTNVEALAQVSRWVQQIRGQVPQAVLTECELVLIEALTNALCHAHRHLPSHTPIEIEAMVSAGCARFQVADRGAPFDLMAELRRRLAAHQAKQRQAWQPAA